MWLHDEAWRKTPGAAASQGRITAPLSATPRRRSSQATALIEEPARSMDGSFGSLYWAGHHAP